jgi:hypothetical protein
MDALIDKELTMVIKCSSYLIMKTYEQSEDDVITLKVDLCFFSFLGWGEDDSTWHVSHYLAYCASAS